jgi:hypothetical protein
VQCGEDGPHDKGHHEDQQVKHDPSRRIWLAWLIVSHDRLSSLALRYRSVFGACRAGAEHLVQGHGSMVCSEEWLPSTARRVGHLVVRRTAHSDAALRDDLPAEPARLPWLRPDRRALLREREHVDLGRCPAGAVTSSPDVLVGGVVCWSCCCGTAPAGHFPWRRSCQRRRSLSSARQLGPGSMPV